MARIMKNLIVYLLPVSLLILSACGNQPIPTQPPDVPTAYQVPNQAQDPCAAESLSAAVEEVNGLMREFDETSQLPSNLDAGKVPDIVSNLQRIRRDAEDLQIPTCLEALKTHQLDHMNLTIQTLIAFVGAADQQALNDGLEKARQEHDLYSIEMARLLGVTLTPLTATPPPQAPPTVSSTP